MYSRRVVLAAFAVLAVAPVGVFAVVFPQAGRFPFRAGALTWSLVVAAVVAIATEARVVRVGAALYALACMATFLAPNPLGANLDARSACSSPHRSSCSPRGGCVRRSSRSPSPPRRGGSGRPPSTASSAPAAIRRRRSRTTNR